MVVTYDTPTRAKRPERISVVRTMTGDFWVVSRIIHGQYGTSSLWRMIVWSRMMHVWNVYQDHWLTGLTLLARHGCRTCAAESESLTLYDFIVLTVKLYSCRIFPWSLISLWMNVYGYRISETIYKGPLTYSGVASEPIRYITLHGRKL